MVVVASLTLWIMAACYLVFPLFGVPRLLSRAAGGLVVAELVALLAWSYGREGCVRRPCSAFAETARTMASLDVPVLSLAVVALGVAYGVRRPRTSVAGRR